MECLSTDISPLVTRRRSQYSSYASYTEIFYSCPAVSQLSQNNENLSMTRVSTSRGSYSLTVCRHGLEKQYKTASLCLLLSVENAFTIVFFRWLMCVDCSHLSILSSRRHLSHRASVPIIHPRGSSCVGSKLRHICYIAMQQREFGTPRYRWSAFFVAMVHAAFSTPTTTSDGTHQ